MKLLLLAITAVFYSLTLKAQDNNIFKKKPWEEYKQKRLLNDTLNRLFSVHPFEHNSNPFENKRGVVLFPLKGVLTGDNGKGDEIYAMQPDKMPCLVPGKAIAFNMPVAGIEKTGKDFLPLLEKAK